MRFRFFFRLHFSINVCALFLLVSWLNFAVCLRSALRQHWTSEKPLPCELVNLFYCNTQYIPVAILKFFFTFLSAKRTSYPSRNEIDRFKIKLLTPKPENVFYKICLQPIALVTCIFRQQAYNDLNFFQFLVAITSKQPLVNIYTSIYFNSKIILIIWVSTNCWVIGDVWNHITIGNSILIWKDSTV